MALPASTGNDDCASDSRSWSCNFLVLSDSGKPIYSRYGEDEEISRICGLLQAIKSSIQCHSSLGDIRSLRSGRLCLVFMSVGSLTLVAIDGKPGSSSTEAFLKLQLEYLYCQIMFTVTARVQEYFTYDPSFDLRSLLGNTDTIVNAILDESMWDGNNPGQYFVGGVDSVFPMSPAIRNRASSVLQVVGLKTDFTAFSILAVEDKLVTMIQPAFPEHQMRVSDLHLLLKTVSRQPGLLSSELWIPVCLPRFSSHDFLFCYTQCLDVASKLCVILVSQQSTTQQFQLFQQAAATMRRSLDLPPASESVLEILESHNEHCAAATGTADSSPMPIDVKWRRNTMEVATNDDDDYVDASGDGERMIPYIPSPTREKVISVFLRDVQAACQPGTRQEMLENYRSIGSVLHFLFRYDARLQAAARQGHPGKLTQCIASPLGFPFVDDDAKGNVWKTYQKLRLRLQLGSATSESTEDALGAMGGTGVDQYCSALVLADSTPKCADGIAFVTDQTETYVAINGPDYEL